MTTSVDFLVEAGMFAFWATPLITVSALTVVLGSTLAAIRSVGVAELEDAAAVVLETDGSFVVRGEGKGTTSSIVGVQQPAPKEAI